MKCLNIIGLILGFLGGALAFLDSWRTNTRLPEDGIYLEYKPQFTTAGWRWCGRTGFVLITLAFFLQLVAEFASQ